MKSFLSALALVFILALGSLAHAQSTDLSGTYAAKGWNPGVDIGGKESYHGTLSMTKNDGVYNITWRIGTATYVGVGIYDQAAKILSVGYGAAGQTWYGAVSYKVEGTTLTGLWTTSGDKSGKVGTEILIRQ